MASSERYQPPPGVGVVRDVVRHWWAGEVRCLDRAGQVADGDGPIPPAQEACRLALANPESARRCAASIALALEKASARGRALTVVHECHLGFELRAIAAPEPAQGGGLVTCGLRRSPITAAEAERIADRLRELHVPISDAQKLVQPGALPVDDRGRLEDLLQLAAGAIANEAEKQSIPVESASRPSRRKADEPTRMVGSSLPILELQRLVERAAQSDATVLIQGESGSGKELVARRLHELGPRRDRRFVAQNCSALNDNLLESALFGHVRGAFTGATRDASGLFDLADGGTLFLDELGDMSTHLQAKLLRVLQEGTYTPVGGAEPRRADVRVIAATHKDLAELVKRREFREDLYYRVNVIRLAVPALRERVEDIGPLTAHFLAKHTRDGRTPRLAPDALALFERYAWPGNIRELQNEVERLCVMSHDAESLGAEYVSARIQQQVKDAPPPVSTGVTTLAEATETLEKKLISESLARHHGNKSAVARELKVARSNLVLKIAKFGLDAPDAPDVD